MRGGAINRVQHGYFVFRRARCTLRPRRCAPDNSLACAVGVQKYFRTAIQGRRARCILKSGFWSPAAQDFSARTCASVCSHTAPTSSASTIFSAARAATSSICSSHKRFELIRHDVTFPLFVEVDQIYNLACPASPIHYQHDPVQTTKTSVHGAINMLGLAKRVKAKNSAGVDLGGLRRPERSSANRRLLGPRQSDRPALLLRRGQALRGDAVFRLPAPAQHADQGRAHLQHLRPAHASERRARGFEFHRAGVARQRHHRLRRRLADPLVLLCRRSDRRP